MKGKKLVDGWADDAFDSGAEAAVYSARLPVRAADGVLDYTTESLPPELLMRTQMKWLCFDKRCAAGYQHSCDH